MNIAKSGNARDREASRPVLALERFLPYRLSVLANRVSGIIAGAYAKDFGLTIPEWRVMAVLGRFPGLSAADVVARTAMDKVRVSRAVTALRGAGRLERETDTHDRRRTRLRLSPAGHAIYRRIAPVALGYEARLLEALTPEERKTLDALLDRLHAQAEQLTEGPLYPDA